MTTFNEKTSLDWPFFALDDDIRPFWTRQLKTGEALVLVTLVNRSGPSPRPVGSQMLITKAGEASGYVSGGCIEGNLVVMAEAALTAGKSRHVSFGDGSPFVDVRLPCGTRIDLVIDVVQEGDLAAIRLMELTQSRRPAFWLGQTDEGRHFCVDPAVEDGSEGEKLLAGMPPDFRPVIRQALQEKAAAGSIGDIYWKRHMPPLRLVINGGDPVGLALARLSRLMGFEIWLNRTAGPDEAPPGLVDRYFRCAGAELFAEIRPDPWTAIVSATHDIDADHDILKHALPSEAFYVGVLGSQRHLAERQKLLLKDGIAPPAIDRLTAPVGLSIGAATANEIAIAILADVIRNWRWG
jgi:xanthine dehydrogenase accessory factor